ncbi:hypothetical protein EMIT0P100_10871 [Pseudomonas sp. IT-P100]
MLSPSRCIGRQAAYAVHRRFVSGLCSAVAGNELECVGVVFRYSEIHTPNPLRVPTGDWGCLEDGLSSLRPAAHNHRTKLRAPRTRLLSCSFPRPPPRAERLENNASGP